MPSYPDLSSLGDFIGTATPITINGPFPGIGIVTSATSINTLPNGTNGQHLVISAGTPTWVTETTTFNFVGQSGTTETVDHGDTITFSSSNLIKTTSAATRVLDIQLDTTGATTGQAIIFNGTNAVWGANTVTTEIEEYFDAQSGTTIILANTPAVGTIVQVMKNGQVLRNGATRDYTLSGTTITFNVVLVSDDVHVIYKF